MILLSLVWSKFVYSGDGPYQHDKISEFSSPCLVDAIMMLDVTDAYKIGVHCGADFRVVEYIPVGNSFSTITTISFSSTATIVKFSNPTIFAAVLSNIEVYDLSGTKLAVGANTSQNITLLSVLNNSNLLTVHTTNIVNVWEYNYNCNQSCATCDQNGACSMCHSFPIFHRHQTLPSCSCENGYYDDGTVICVACNYMCATCDGSSSYCTSCRVEDNRTLVDNTCVCADNYAEVNGQCIANTDCLPNCVTCKTINHSWCLSCSPGVGLILDSGNGLCQCSSGNFYDIQSQECSMCHSNCLTCNMTSKHCTSCSIANQMQLNNNGLCVCMTGYRDNQGVCELNSTCSSANCQSCKSDNLSWCLICIPAGNWLINNSTGICECNEANGYVLETQNVCSACDESCARCVFTSSKCTQCKLDYLLNKSRMSCDVYLFANKNDYESLNRNLKTATYIAIGANSVFSVLSLTSNILNPLLQVSKLSFFLVLNVKYPQLVHGFLQELKGINLFQAMTIFNIFDRNIPQVAQSSPSRWLSSSSRLPKSFYIQQIQNSILFNGGGVLFVLIIQWIFCLPVFIMSYKKKKCQSVSTGLAPPTPSDSLQVRRNENINRFIYFYEKVVCHLLVMLHEAFTLVINFSISIQVLAFLYYGQESSFNFTGDIILLMVLTAYTLSTNIYVFKLINKQEYLKYNLRGSIIDVQDSLTTIASELSDSQNSLQQMLVTYYLENSKRDMFLARNFKAIHSICQNMLLPAIVTVFLENFKYQVQFWLAFEVILLLIAVLVRPRTRQAYNIVIVLDFCLWISAMVSIQFIAFSIEEITKKRSYTNEDVDILDKRSITLIASIYMILFLKPAYYVGKVIVLTLKKLNSYNKKKKITICSPNKLKVTSQQENNGSNIKKSDRSKKQESASVAWEEDIAIINLEQEVKKEPRQLGIIQNGHENYDKFFQQFILSRKIRFSSVSSSLSLLDLHKIQVTPPTINVSRFLYSSQLSSNQKLFEITPTHSTVYTMGQITPALGEYNINENDFEDF